MKCNRIFLFGLLAFTFLLSACTSTPQQIVDTEIPKQVIEKARNATVLIVSGGTHSNAANGSGFFVASDKIVTNIHVVTDAKIVFAVSEKKVYNIEKVIGYDPKYDLVILKVSGEGNPLPFGEAKVDDPIFAVGYPGGGYDRIEGTVHGIRKSNNILRLTFKGFPENSLVGGNSGGPILNHKGEVIGVATTENSGFGFASLSSVLKALLNSSGSNELSLLDWQKENSIRAWAYAARAQNKYESQNYDEAIKFWDKVIEELPSLPIAHQQRAMAKTKLGELKANLGDLEEARSLYQAASEDYRVAIKQTPDSAFPFVNMGKMKILRGEDGDYKTAIEYLNTAIRLNPNLAIAYFNLGRAKQESGDHHGTIKAYELAIKQNSNYADAYLNLGNVKQEISDYEGAIEAFNKVIELNAKLVVEATLKMGNAKLESKDYDGAIEAYNKVIESKLVHLHPQAYYKRGLAKEARSSSKTKESDWDKTLGYFGWGVNYYGSKQYRLAIDNFDKFLDLKKDYADAYYYRGLAQYGLDKDSAHEKVIADYTAAIERKPDYAEAYYQRGLAHFAREQYQKAIDDYTAAIERKPDYAEAYYQRGLAHFAREQYQKAIDDYTAAIERKPDYAEAYHSRGLVREDQEQDDVAKSDFAMALLLRGVANWEEEQYKEAIDKFDKAIKLIPEYAPAYYNRGRAKSRLAHTKTEQEDLKEARKLYQEALADFNKFNKLNPKEVLLYHENSGRTQFLRGKDFNDDGGYKVSIDHYNEVIRIKPDSDSAYLNRGWAQCFLGYSEANQGNLKEARKLYNSAIKDFNKVIKLNPENIRAYYNWIGLANAGLGQAERVTAALEKVKELRTKTGK